MDLSVLLNPEAILVLGGLFIVGLIGVIIAMAYLDDQTRPTGRGVIVVADAARAMVLRTGMTPAA